jgi:hypothetical protein
MVRLHVGVLARTGRAGRLRMAGSTKFPVSRFSVSAEDSTPDRGQIFSTNTILVTLGTVGLAGRRPPSSKGVCRFDREAAHWGIGYVPIEAEWLRIGRPPRAGLVMLRAVGSAGQCRARPGTALDDGGSSGTPGGPFRSTMPPGARSRAGAGG